jgi:two-component system, chemotaxis family, CheB/CheR fusion protein
MKNVANQDTQKLYIVGIGASAGGLEAIESFFKTMPANTGLAFVVVQHLSPDYKSLMAELLSKHTAMSVHRIEDGMMVEANNIYLIPPRKNLTLFHGRLLLKEQVRNEGINLPIDVFFQSLADDCNEKSIGVVLSGTGSDGTRGIRAIKERGGMVMVQDEESAKFNGMPNNAIATGLADFILSPDEMPSQLLSFVKHPYSTTQQIDVSTANGDTDLARIYSLLRNKVKVDFTYYKPSTVLRRIERRVSINQLSDFAEYIQFMERNPQEIITLYQELLIGVTSFFRDGFVYEEFNERWLPEIIKQIDDEVRVWTSACSTGEEAYSLAMLLAEYQEDSGHHFKVKIFATDIDQTAIEKASLGRYPESIVADVPTHLLNKYFSRREDKFQIVQKIREMVVFAQHNLIKDPPFTNINIISCRNVLIYLQPVLQKKILELFNFSLRRDGLLILGTSETIGEMVDYFEMVSPKAKFYQSKGKYKPLPVPFHQEKAVTPSFQPSYTSNYTHSQDRRFEDKTLERFINSIKDDILPFTLIVNEAMEITHIFGDAKDFLSIPSGKMVPDITKMVINELAIPIATGVQRSISKNENVTLSNIRIRDNEKLRIVHLHIKNLPAKKGQEKLLAILFNEVIEQVKDYRSETQSLSYDINKEASQRINDLEQELQFTRENLQATVEELETSNEELQATNEELLASNEELQSTNEELQSVNEELYTVNAEYQGKITELTLLNNDLDNLFNSTNIATLFLDENLEVRRFTPRLESIFHILSSDIGRPFFHLSNSIKDLENLNDLVSNVSTTQLPIEKEVSTNDGTWYLLRIMPYAVSDTVYAGVILTFVDIDELKKTENELRLRDQEEMERLSAFVHYSNDAITLQDINGNIITWNRGAERLYGWTEKEALSMKYESIVAKSSKPLFEIVIDKLKQGELVEQYEAKRVAKNGDEITVLVTPSVLYSKYYQKELFAFTERDMRVQHKLVKEDCISCIQNIVGQVMDYQAALMLLNVDGNIVAWNKGAESLYGWNNQEAVSMHIQELIPEQERSNIMGLLGQLVSGEYRQQTIKTTRVTKNQQFIPVTMTASVLDNNSGDVLLIVVNEQAVKQ